MTVSEALQMTLRSSAERPLKNAPSSPPGIDGELTQFTAGGGGGTREFALRLKTAAIDERYAPPVLPVRVRRCVRGP